MEKNKIRKYFKYAIGEILLVVIGILIALSLNNWNELQKDYNFEKQTLVDLRQEFNNNKKVFTTHINTKKESKLNLSKYIKLLMYNKATFSEYSLIRNNNGFAANTFDPSQGVINSLISSGLINKISNKTLRYKLSKWHDLLADYSEDEILYLDLQVKKIDIFEKARIPFANIPEYKHSAEELNLINNNLIKTVEHGNHLGESIGYLGIIIGEGENLISEMETIIKLIDLEIEK
ncbi:MAG: DUF6090 family protein [Polaribacter sp.]|uniref:DUF6090 family protein n=1 Tax=Polaribacter sp. TaxID=1920175 RepID=UPI003BB1DC32